MSEVLQIENPQLCGLGEGERCCAFLTMGQGFQCGRTLAGIEDHIRVRLAAGTMNAKYDPGDLHYPECQQQRPVQDPA